MEEGELQEMTNLNRIKIEVNDSTTSHNGNISVEFESKTIDVNELEAIAVKTIERVRVKKK